MAQFAVVAAISGTGSVFAIDLKGHSRLLKIGDSLQKGETLQTVGDARVELMMEDGRLLAVAPAQSVRLDENVAESEQRPTAQDSAITTPTTADTIIQALERGTDLSTQLEATAAGLGGGTGADGGSTFVQLLRITEGVDPLSYNYSFTAPDLPPDLQTQPETATTSTLTLTADSAVFEGSKGVTYTATLGTAALSDMIITLSNGAVISISAGSITGSVLVPVQGDDVYKDGETLKASVVTAQGGGFASLTVNDSNVITVVNDTIDTTLAKVSVSVLGGDGGASNVVEGNSLTFRFSVDHAPQTDLILNVTIGGVAQTVTITAGKMFEDVAVDTRSDDIYVQGSSTITGTINSVSSTVDGYYENLDFSGASASATVVDDHDVTQLQLFAVTQGEGDVPIYTLANSMGEGGSVRYVVLAGDGKNTPFTIQPGGTITVNVGLDGDTATRSADYISTVPLSVTVGTEFAITASNDNRFENSEVYRVSLGADWSRADEFEYVTYSDQTVTTSITDDDTQPAFSINDVTVNESAGTITFTVSKTGATDVASSVHYDVAPNSAVTPGDYAAGTSALSGDLSFAANVTTQTITLNVTSDTIYELTENFNVNLSAAVQATIADNQGVGTITDDDTQPAFSINDVTVNESAGTITFTVSKTGATDVASSVDFSVAPNTAVTPGDYSGTLTGTLNFAANASTQTITLNVTSDAVYELTENFNVNLLNPVQATIADNQGVGTITDDDLPPPITYGSSSGWFMEHDVGQHDASFKLKSSGSDTATLAAGRTIHWDVLIKGIVNDAMTLSGSSLPTGTLFNTEKLYTGNGDTLFRVYLTASGGDVVLTNSATGGQFYVDVVGVTPNPVVQIINSDEYVKPHSSFNENYDASFESLTLGLAGNDYAWQSNDPNGGELTVTPIPVFSSTSTDFFGGSDLVYGGAGADTLTGGAGHDFIDGRAGGDLITGDAGQDVLMGGIGNDVIVGGNITENEVDLLVGGQGNDILTGGGGSDTFKWELGDQGQVGSPAVDLIKDFNFAAVNTGGDVLNVGDLLLGEHNSGVGQNLTNYLHFTEVAGNATLSIDHDGGGTFASDQTITFDNMSLSELRSALGAAVAAPDADIISKMLEHGNLKTDP